MTKEQLDSVLAIIDGYDARMKLAREYFDRREPVPEKHKQYLAPLEDEDVVKAFEALRPLVARVRELERQRDWLAKLLGDLCTTQKDGECPLFYACPASGFGWSCGNAIKEDWIYTAEEAAKEAGE